jgi:hypothetical protein
LAATLDSDSVFVECGIIIRRLAMLFAGCWGSLRAEKKARWRGHWIACAAAGLLWNPSAGSKTGEVELPDKNSGASWDEDRRSMRMPRE